MATVEYKDNDDGETHLVEVPPSSLLKGGDTPLNIGDKVTLVKKAPSVCVSVGSTGTVVGGTDVYTVSFEMTHSHTGKRLEDVVTVTQDQVPRDVLRFEGEGEDDDMSEDSEDESSEDSMDMEEELEGGGNRSSVMTTLKHQLSPKVLEEVVLALNLDELEDLSSILLNSDNTIDMDTNSVMLLMLD
jgi:hypothetical protein